MSTPTTLDNVSLVSPGSVKLKITNSQSRSIKLVITNPKTLCSNMIPSVTHSLSNLDINITNDPLSISNLPPLPKVKDRIADAWYIYKGKSIRWDGKYMRCTHNKLANQCKECKGNQICQHDQVRGQCKRCGGSQVCQHNRLRGQCKDCGGSQVCKHNRRKSACKDCKGTQICVHNRRRHKCKDCDGSEICEHNRQQPQCRDCYTHPHNFCQLCTNVFVGKRSRYHPLCCQCYYLTHPEEPTPTRFKMKEHILVDYLTAYCPEYQFIHDQIIVGGCSKRRPDMLLDCLSHSIIIEIDENQHEDYKCENKRMMEIFLDLGNRPLVVIRFNPDKYVDEAGNKHESLFTLNDKNVIQIANVQALHQRIISVVERIRFHAQKIPNKELTIERLYYNEILM